MNKDALDIVAWLAWGLIVLINILLIAYGIFTGGNKYEEDYDIEKRYMSDEYKKRW